MAKSYLRSEFRDWLKKQISNRDKPYKKTTIDTYIQALRNNPPKLNGISLSYDDIFNYVTLEEYRKAKETIINAPNYKEINIQSGNGAFSAGMDLYEKFLIEYLQPSCWIFQGNPKYYDVLGAVKELDSIQWSVKQYKNRIKQGDHFYLWMSGPDGGIVASGTVGCDPEERKLNPDDKFVVDDSFTGDVYIAVDLLVEKRLVDSIISRKQLLDDDRTHKLEILSYPNATNFRVTKEQQEVIESMIAGTYHHVPVKQEEAAPKEKRRYWVYAPGENSRFWDQFYQESIMAIGWDELGDLSKYDSKEAMKVQMKTVYGQDRTYKNDGHATWQFANEMNPGDIVYVKKGTRQFIGRGIITSGYCFDDSRQEYKNIRDVNWTHNGEWEYYNQIVQKTLTDITPYNSYYKYLETLFAGEVDTADIEDQAITYPEYTEEDFLSEVYMDQHQYATLKNLLLKKKNVILQGAPGVGKTFCAKRLAYSMMGEKDDSRVMMVQFHQSYSYEDFIMGFRPHEDGFALKTGPFYDFCKQAEPDDRAYFFIIDEINRGNMSKIFGELLMLIEADKRSQSLRLLYSDEQFSVPGNVHIIGMMNTADRSLAMLDYALRRRFAFFPLLPAFDSEGFQLHRAEIADSTFDKLIDCIISLNRAIEDDVSLGAGFQIGHSYFCLDEEPDGPNWMRDIVEYEIIPTLKEYWFDESSKWQDWANRLRGIVR